MTKSVFILTFALVLLIGWVGGGTYLWSSSLWVLLIGIATIAATTFALAYRKLAGERPPFKKWGGGISSRTLLVRDVSLLGLMLLGISISDGTKRYILSGFAVLVGLSIIATFIRRKKQKENK